MGTGNVDLDALLVVITEDGDVSPNNWATTTDRVASSESDSRSGTIVTKHRTGSWAGTTRKGKPFTHEADFTVTWDAATKCITRDGHADTTIAARELTRTVAGFKRCGVGHLGCPQSGTITLERKRGANSTRITLDYVGGSEYTVTGPNGRKVTRELDCK